MKFIDEAQGGETQKEKRTKLRENRKYDECDVMNKEKRDTVKRCVREKVKQQIKIVH